jgi:5-methylcytosine-specific restriction endonuclease McrA
MRNCCERHKNGKYLHWSCTEPYNPAKRHARYLAHPSICRECGGKCSQFVSRCKKCYGKWQSKTSKGRKLPTEWARHISEGLKGRVVSEETRAILSTQRRGKNKEWLAKIRPDMRGSNNPAYVHGLCYTKEMNAFYVRRRKARIRGNGGSHTLEQWLRVKALYNNTCPSCLRAEPTIKLTEDHVVPLFYGGTDNIDNIQPLCAHCNTSKYTKTVRYLPSLCWGGETK